MKFKDTLNAVRNYDSNRRKKVNLNEAGKSKKTSSSGTRDPKATKVDSVAPALGGSAGQFTDSPVDLSQIYNAYSSDAYIRRAIDNVSSLMMKSGYELKGKNKDTLTYVKNRLSLIGESTGISFEELITELSDNFVLYSNAPIVKARGQENLGGLAATGYYGGDPISGLFPVSPRFFKVKRTDMGDPDGYEVSSDGSTTVEFKTEDIAHLHYRKQTGAAYGTPYIQNVLDDVLILRNIEENVSQLIYRNLFPLTVYTVGSTKEGYEATDAEIEETVAKLQEMRLDEIHVLPERHKIETVNSGNAVLDASSYLTYFRQRVFTGLGMSESVMGVSGSANKSTADNQNSDLNDLVKDFQKRFRAQIQSSIINEILYEGGYDPVLNEEDSVIFEFVEIEQSSKIARENHIINLFNNNLVSFDEARVSLGYEPVADLSNFRVQLIDNDPTTSTDKSVENADQPENQHGKATNPSKNQTKEKKSLKKVLTQDNALVNLRMSTEEGLARRSVIEYIELLEKDCKVKLKEGASMATILEELNTQSKPKLADRLNNTLLDEHLAHLDTSLSPKETHLIKQRVARETESIIDKLISDIIIRGKYLNESTNKLTFIESSFESLSYRVKMLPYDTYR